MEGTPQSYWYPALYATDSVYPSPAPSDLSPLPQPYPSLDMNLKSTLGPTRDPIRPKSLNEPSSAYSHVRLPLLLPVAPASPPPQPLSAALHPPDRFRDSYLPAPRPSMASPYLLPRRRSASSPDHLPRPPSPARSSASRSSNGFESSFPPLSGPVRPRLHPSHRKQRLRDSDRKQICLYHLAHPNARQEDIGAEFGVERSTISKILKAKDKWLNVDSDEESIEQTSKHRPSKFPEVETKMLYSLQKWSDDGTNITDNLIRDRALEIAKEFRISTDRFKGSAGWIENFKHRHDIRRGEWLQAKNRLQSSDSTDPLKSSSTTNDASLPSQRALHNHTETQVSNQEWSASKDHPHHAPALVLDPILQDASVRSHQLHDPHTAIQHSPQQVSYDYQALYSAPVHVPPHGFQGAQSPERPTLAEAGTAINTLIAYLDHDGQHILKNEERSLLAQIKFALFQFAGGMPFER